MISRSTIRSRTRGNLVKGASVIVLLPVALMMLIDQGGAGLGAGIR